ncbi:hypothetical protein XA68_12170 [Ophiocordyceps unilateralis]|uniref:Peroxin 20 n=1 Tax=Ophiocordyceps unilateralis TaxID=268505 RepID=A0A2A9PPD4_OPHUN|nr:hypothetical protein XA68_12170 [Ophiocordyceps unilateralis]
MAEPSCSGTTPFKRLVDHQSRDVSHHQDRLVDRGGANGHASFRSLPRPSAPGHHGFGAFLDSRPVPVGFPAASPDAAGRLTVHASALQADLAHSPAFPAPAPAPDLSDWSADFRRFSAGQQHMHPTVTHPTQQQRPPSSALPFQPTFVRQPGLGFAPILDQRNATPASPLESDFDREMAKWVASHSEGSMREVDAAMDQFARELEREESAVRELFAVTAQKAGSDTRLTDLETPEIGNLSLQEPRMDRQAALEPQEAQNPQSPLAEDAASRGKSAVSEAAERLLESVQHENGDKWQNSVFLSLMRDFRDGRKDIVENEIRQTSDVVATAVAAEGKP